MTEQTTEQRFLEQFGFGVGSIIEYGSFGGDLRRVRVEMVEFDVKNGRPGFDGVLLNADDTESDDGDVWGYCSQVVRIAQA